MSIQLTPNKRQTPTSSPNRSQRPSKPNTETSADEFVPAGAAWQSHGRMIIKPEHLGEFKVAVSKITAPTRSEPGCLYYQGFQVLDEKGAETNLFEFRETWTSRTAMFVDHLEKSAHMKAFFQEIKFSTDESFVEKFVPLSSGYAKMLD